MAISSRILVLSVLGFLTILATATTTTKAQATSTLSMSSALARRFLSTSAPSGESESPPYNSPTVGSKPSPDNNMPPVTMPDSGPRSQSSGGMQPKKFGKGSCKSWRKKLDEVQKLISTMGSIAKIFKGNNNNNNNDDGSNNKDNNKDNNNNGYGSNNDNNNDDNTNNDNGNNNNNYKNGGYDSDMTIMDALMSDSNDGYTSLAREAITSLLNAYAYEGFPYTPNQVRHLFNAAYYGAPGDVAKQATMFQEANEQLL